MGGGKANRESAKAKKKRPASKTRPTQKAKDEETKAAFAGDTPRQSGRSAAASPAASGAAKPEANANSKCRQDAVLESIIIEIEIIGR